MPYDPEFGRRFDALLRRHNLYGELEPYKFLRGTISKATIGNWRKGAPAPGPLQIPTLRKVISFFPEEDPEDWVAMILSVAA